jgi:hypothetical protein
MSHIFISYSHYDEKFRDTLITGLQKEGIDYWADIGLEVGEAWREQIDTNLEEAFALVVIVTNNSLQSPYVTYEWSWALGHEIPVLPLLFEQIIVPIHGRLNAIQHHKCHTEIPKEVFEAIKRYQKQSPFVVYIEVHISEMMLPFRYALATMTWLYSYDELANELYSTLTSIARLFLYEIYQVTGNKLPQLWLQNYHSFPREQKRKLQLLSERTEHLGAYMEEVIIDPSHDKANAFINMWKKEIEPVLQQFIGYDNWHLNEFDGVLQVITESGLILDSDDEIRTMVVAAGLLIPADLPDKFLLGLDKIFQRLSGNSYSTAPSSDDDLNTPPD